MTELGRISHPAPIDRDDAKVEMMKKKWVPAIFLSGFELVLHLRANKKVAILRGITYLQTEIIVHRWCIL